MIDEATRKKINVIKHAIAENLEYKDLPEDFKEKYNEKFFRSAVKKTKEWEKYKRKKAN